MPRVLRQNSASLSKSVRSAALTKKILAKLLRSGYFGGTFAEAGTRPVEAIAFWPFAVACLVFAIVVPVVFYPFAASGWAAIDLAMRPLDEDELRDAEAWRADRS